MHTVVPGWFGASSVWFIPLIWRLVKAALPGGAGLRGPGTIRLWLGFFCVLLASCALEAMLVDIAGFDALGHALASGLGRLAGHAAAALGMTALFFVSLSWLLDFRWRDVLAWADVSLGLGLNIRARRDDEGATRGAPRPRRSAASEAPSPHGMAGMNALNTIDPQPTLDGSRRRRPTVWRPPATSARTAGGAAAAVAAASGSNAARAAAPSWRVEPSLSGAADTAAAWARPEPVAPAGWLREPVTGTARAASVPGSAFDNRRQVGLAGQPAQAPGAAPVAGQSPTPPQPLAGVAIGNAPWRAEAARPSTPGPRTIASSASAALQAAQAASAANAATRGFTLATSPDPITSPFASPPVRRNAPPPVAGSTAARAAATAPTPRPPKPPRPFVWPTKTARNALRPQTDMPQPPRQAATPAYSRPAAPAQSASPAPLSTGVLETLRSIEETAARWTTLAGASLARRNNVDETTPGRHATQASTTGTHAQDAQFPSAAPVIAVEGGAMAAPALDTASTANARAAAPGDAGTASWSPPAPVVATTPVAPDARAFDAVTPFDASPSTVSPNFTADAAPSFDAPQSTTIPHDTAGTLASVAAPDTAAASPLPAHGVQQDIDAPHIRETQPTTPAAPVTALDHARFDGARAGLATTPASATEPASAAATSTVWAPAAIEDATMPDAAGWHTAPSLAAQVGTAQPFGFAQPTWPENEHGLAPWVLLDDEPLEDEVPPEPAPVAAAFAASTRMDVPTAANGSSREAEAAASVPPAPEPTADTTNIVRFPRVAHDAQRAVADVGAPFATSDARTATPTPAADAAAHEDAHEAEPSRSDESRVANPVAPVTADASSVPPAAPVATTTFANAGPWVSLAASAASLVDAAANAREVTSVMETEPAAPPQAAAEPGDDAASSDSFVAARPEPPQTANWQPPAAPAPSIATMPAVATPREPVPAATTQTLAAPAPSTPTAPFTAAPWELAPSAITPPLTTPEPSAPATPFAAAPWDPTPSAAAQPLAPSTLSTATTTQPTAAPWSAAPAAPETPDPAPRQPARGYAPTSFEFQPLAASEVELPGLDLLERASSDIEPVSEQKLAETSQLIEQRLQEFKVPVTVVGASAGPVITRFEVEPALGVRGSQIVGLMKDLSRGLGLTSIRVIETIPGKTCMGLELPNARRQMIRLSEILESGPYQRSPSKLTIAMGKDIVGHPVVTDLAKAPHMLVAGTTGSGKSVAINAMILSLLYKATPEDVRLIMIDPKMLELSVYEGIPHLLAPVVTDMKLAANALTWCVGEMEKRYRLMSAVGVRNLAGFNQKIRDAEAHERKIGNPFSLTPEAPEPLAPLPMIVVVIDELADLMMVAGKKIEELIARLAQKARAAGIHLILATQRPSVDVITGLIKANIPTRVAFQVSSKIDSRTILDQMGAESLLGQGDMLFLPPGTGYPQRVHGAFVADEEVHAVVEYLKQFGEPEYVEGILDGPATEGAPQDLFGDAPEAEADPLYDEAVAFVVRTRRASISSVQRQLRIGYNRAARLVEQMEAAGLVSPMGINGSREVLVPGQPE